MRGGSHEREDRALIAHCARFETFVAPQLAWNLDSIVRIAATKETTMLKFLGGTIGVIFLIGLLVVIGILALIF